VLDQRCWPVGPGMIKGCPLLTASAVGVPGILVAFGAGSAFMGQTSDDVASYLMTIGTAVAIAAYALGLYRLPARNI